MFHDLTSIKTTFIHKFQKEIYRDGSSLSRGQLFAVLSGEINTGQDIYSPGLPQKSMCILTFIERVQDNKINYNGDQVHLGLYAK